MTKPEFPDARIFTVDTRFHKMARRKGGVPRAKAVRQAQAKVEEAKPQFDEWLDGALAEFAALIETAQAGTAEADWIADANSRSRQLRDSAASLGFELIAFIAGSLCDILDAIEAGSECNMESITCHFDALMLACKTGYRHLKPEQVPELTKGLHRVVKHVAV